MRVRTQLIAAISVTLLVGLVVAVFTVGAAQDENAADERQSRAQTASHEVSGLLVLTQEYVRHTEDRSAQQWRQRHGEIVDLLQEEYTKAGIGPTLLEFRSVVQALPELFSSLQQLPQEPDSFTQRRKELLIDQLLTSTQAMSDLAYQWYQEAARNRRQAELRFQALAIASPLAMFAILVAVSLLVRRRVLGPLSQLDDATAAVARGDLNVRTAYDRNDEFGQLSRRFNEMTLAQAKSIEKMHRTQKQLKAVADNLPARIAHVDGEGRYTFTNAGLQQAMGQDADTLFGRKVVDANGGPGTDMAPHVVAALGGEYRAFERTVKSDQGDVYYHSVYIPDTDAEGQANGYYEMTFDISERKRAELAQAQSEQRIRSILTHAPDAFIGIDADSRVHEWNRQAEITFGWQRDEVLGKPLMDFLIPPDARAAHTQGMDKFALTGEGPIVNRRIEIQGQNKQGQLIPIELSVAAVRDGERYGANAFLRDITERKRAETQLLASERRLRDITDHIPAMVGYFDRDERCLYANSTVLRIYGIKAEDTESYTLRSGLGEEAYAIHEPHVRQVLKGEVAHFDGHIQHKGQGAYFQAHMVPDRAEDGSVRGFYVMTFDVTRVRRAEVEQARSEQLLRAITNNVPVLISYIDAGHRIQFANDTYRLWLGVDPVGLVGMHLRDVGGAALYEQRLPYVERAFGGERVEFDSEMLMQGVTRSTHTSYVPDPHPDGSVRGLYAVTVDVSSLKRGA